MNRAVFFVDGNNWYHGCIAIGLTGLARLNHARLCERLVERRQWLETRYYVGQVPESGNVRLAWDQKRFLARLVKQDPRIVVSLGRLEPRQVRSQAAHEFQDYLASVRHQLPLRIHDELQAIVRSHLTNTVMIEKAVDVQIAVDMVVMAERGRYETAYLLSSDGDLRPAVEAVIATGRRVIVVSPAPGARLREVATTFIRLRRPWFDGLFDPPGSADG